MLISNYAEVKWNSKNKKKFVNLGYTFTAMGDTFNVEIEDLTKYSNAIVRYTCDYCGKECSNIWQVYNRLSSVVNKDCCGDCLQKKADECVAKKYGGHEDMFYSANDKRKKTNIEKYGCDNPFGNKDVQEKIANTNLNKYGVRYNQQSKEVRERTEKTCEEKYGVSNYVELFKGKFIKENSPVWKGGPKDERTERATYEYRMWRSAVFSRDKYTCQKCGVRSGDGRGRIELNAHHIMNWKDSEENRYDVDNGITLCSDCHSSFHSLYGKHNNTQEQINSFLETPVSDKKIC